MENGQIIELRGLAYAYPDGTRALQGVSLDVAAGEKVALIGHNGAGKSTLLLQIIGILRGEGVVRVDGLTLSNDSVRAIRARVGLVFQNPDDQLFSPTVFDDVAFGPLHMGLPEHAVRERVQRALEQVRMTAFADRMPHHLSLGEKKQIAIATVLSMEPSILALDEPSAGLDPGARQRLMELLQSLPQTMLIASHDLDFVRQVCDRAVLMAEGRVERQVVGDDLSTLERDAFE
jgi:cobalt/nickel transport system ATP-binding protein